eukprot:2943601-Rhodomonas_salina.1
MACKTIQSVVGHHSLQQPPEEGAYRLPAHTQTQVVEAADGLPKALPMNGRAHCSSRASLRNLCDRQSWH